MDYTLKRFLITISISIALFFTFYLYTGEIFPYAYEILPTGNNKSPDPRHTLKSLLSGDQESIVFAHRGDHFLTKENSLEAVKRAYNRGYDGVELDVSVTADSVPILYHDVDATDSTQTQTVQSKSYNDLLHENRSVEALDTVLDEMGGKILMILELKYQSGVKFSWIKNLCNNLKERRLEDAVILSSLNIHIVGRLSEDCPNFHYMFEAGMDLPGYHTKLKKLYHSDLLSMNWRLLEPDDKSGIPDSFFSDYILSVYTPNTKCQLEKSISIGANIIQTDRPGLLTYLKKHPRGFSLCN